MKYDIIVIGSGIGGLTAASALSQMKKKVLVLEKHPLLGGQTRSFKRKSWSFNVGFHMHQWPTKNRERMIKLWNILGGEKITFETEPVHYLKDGYSYKHHTEEGEYKEELIKLFPDEKDKIIDYIQKVKEIGHDFSGYCTSMIISSTGIKGSEFIFGKKVRQYDTVTVADYLNMQGMSKGLQNHLTFFWDNYGAPPSEASFTSHAIYAESLLGGVLSSNNPSIDISKGFLKKIIDSGGEIQKNAGVAEFILKGRSVIGVKTEDGRIYETKKVISTIGAMETYELLPQQFHPTDLATYPKNDNSFIMVNYGFEKGALEKFSIPPGGSWYYDGDDVDIPIADDYNVDIRNVSLYRDEDTLQCLPMVKSSKFFNNWGDSKSSKRPISYKEVMERYESRMISFLDKAFPGIKEQVRYTNVSSPLTIRDYTFHQKGTCYGVGPFVGRYSASFMKPSTPVRNLYLGGQDVCTSGVLGAFCGGLMSASTICKKDIANVLAK